jgi:FKBP-type peptidyl-prolyl cis-trans isomerase
MSRIRVFILLSLLAVACNDSDHFGYDRLENSVHFRLISLGDDGKPVANADHLSMTLHLYRNDTVQARKVFKRINWNESEFPSYFKKLLLSSNHGDSIALVGDAKDLDINALFGFEIIDFNEKDIHLEVYISEALNDKQLRDVLAKDRLKSDGELNEKVTLNRVLDSLKMGDEDFVDGVYVKLLKSTDGPKPIKGDFITVNYSARLGSGKLVDDNFMLDPFSYEVGKPGQVIPGFSIGVSQMTEGAEAIFVLPSTFGFGPDGSSSQIIPGFSVLVYRVKLIKVSD